MSADETTGIDRDDAAALEEALAAERAESERLMLSGLVIGAVDVAAIAVLGAGCPFCVVGVPALVAWGAYRRWKVHGLARELARQRAASMLGEDVTPDRARVR